jgi:hypothetical protein
MNNWVMILKFHRTCIDSFLLCGIRNDSEKGSATLSVDRRSDNLPRSFFAGNQFKELNQLYTTYFF